MARRYFEKFPIITYNNFNVRDITVAAKVMNKYVNLPYNYNRYELDAEQRADQVSNDFYSDPYMAWMVYYANKIVDPYYGWMLSEDDFNKHLEAKYGSVEVTYKRIVEFRNNWFNDAREISPSQYDAMFGEYSEPHAKYWTPNYDDVSGRTISYTRRVSRNVINTNKLARVAVSNNSPSKLSEGDLVDLKAATNGSTLGTAEVCMANTTSVTLKNIIGEIANSYYVVLDSDAATYCRISEHATTSNTSANTWTIVNIPAEEYVYWEPYTVNEMERELNGEKKSIKLIDPGLAIKLSDRLEEELNG